MLKKKIVRKKTLKEILAAEKVLYAAREQQKVFPFVFTYNVPLTGYKIISFHEFFSITMENLEYVFDEEAAIAVIPRIVNLEAQITRNIDQLKLRRLTLTRNVAYHIICINNLTVYYNEFLKLEHFNSNNDLNCYALYHLMQLEELLTIHRESNLDEITITEGHHIIGSAKRKVWSLFISLHYSPRIFISNFYQNLANIRHMQQRFNNNDNVPNRHAATDFDKMFLMLRLKGDRLIRDYIQYYINRIRNYPDYNPRKYVNDFILETEEQLVMLFKRDYPNVLPLWVKQNSTTNEFVLVNSYEN